LVVVAVLSYLLLTGGVPGQKLLTPPFVAFLLVANLVPAIALIVLVGRRVAKGRAARSEIGGSGRLHVRLVGIFSLVASIPMLLVVIFASLLFQYGVEFWFSDRARGMLENASSLAQGYYQEKQTEVARETATMAGDLRVYLSEAPSDSPVFAEGYALQVLNRNLSESAIVEIGPSGAPRTIAMVNPDARPVEQRVSAAVIARLAQGEPVVVSENADRIEAVTRLSPDRPVYLYASRIADRQALMQTDRAKAVLGDYNSLLERSRTLQLQFNAALFLISLLIVGVAVWIALTVADRLVRPVGELVGAARRVEAGDLTARVAAPIRHDEVGTLGNAFNRMTRRLEEQTGALDSRRALIEAVLSGVTAGVGNARSGCSIRRRRRCLRPMPGRRSGSRCDSFRPSLPTSSRAARARQSSS
jgi:two-component system nitrogen regulation sensor histidine kinase NtrY